MNALLLLTTVTLAKKPPEAEDVVAGWTGFAVAVGMILAVALLCWSFVRQMRKVRQAKETGVYGEAEKRDAPEGAAPGSTDSTTD